MRKIAYFLPVGAVLALWGAWSARSWLRDDTMPPVDAAAGHDPFRQKAPPPAVSGAKGGRLAAPGSPSVGAEASPGKTPGARKVELLGLLERIAAGAPAELRQVGAVLRAAAAELSEGDRAEVIGMAGALVAQRNLESADGLLAQLDDFRDRHRFVQALLESAVSIDPRRAADWAATLGEVPLRDAACTALAMEWSKLDQPAALSWAQGLSEPAARGSAFEGVAWTWAQQDPKAAYTWAAAISEAELRNQVMVKIAKMIAVRDPQQALGWALQFPEGPGREQALNYAMFQWASRDLEAATTWTAGVRDPDLRSSSEVAIARSWSVGEAEGATNWAAGIPDPAGRVAALKTTLLKWAEENPAAAAQWIGQSGVSPINEEIFRAVTGGLAAAQPAVREAWLQGIPHPAWRELGQEILATRAAVPPRR